MIHVIAVMWHHQSGNAIIVIFMTEYMEKACAFMTQYNLEGLLIGLATFLIIGLFHPLVIKGEYYFGAKIRWAFLIAGVVFLALTVAVRNTFASSLLGVTAFSCFWSIHEVTEQVERVRKGWFPANSKRSSGSQNHGE